MIYEMISGLTVGQKAFMALMALLLPNFVIYFTHKRHEASHLWYTTFFLLTWALVSIPYGTMNRLAGAMVIVTMNVGMNSI